MKPTKYRLIRIFKDGSKKTGNTTTFQKVVTRKQRALIDDSIRNTYVEYFDPESGKNGLWVSQL